ncbi:uncharacterized protein MELLADRAFT_85461 [Melampsora larici-populina 98AG31]|uniref:Uncharacterized protein n=1 Tax=Melampsora larici-populina (strain 98AG31 / pathotype 3-4-7) TaxID=747676 RepID=F4RIS6_MELLP|nr:uncharacterized protein MELLADRAFT_85461 [Melampsora larici-populina 98AG31]EGG07779.1 hypothetical protein MELLADRAFT_85461 [Melampsora larici-populina 98AG31]
MKAFQKHLQIGSSSQNKSQSAPSPSLKIDEQSQWVAFPPLPSPAKNSFSTAVQFVSTTFKPFADSSARHSPPVTSTQNNRNVPAPVSRPPAISNSTLAHPSPLLKRVRTQTDPTHRTNLSRKRSKSDIGQSPSQPRKTDELSHLRSRYPIIENEVFEKNSALFGSLNSRPFNSRQRAYGSSASLASNLTTAPSSRRRVDVQNPGVLLRHRHRTLTNTKPNEPLCRQMSLRSVPSTTSPYTHSNSRPSSPDATSMTRNGRQRAKTIGSVLAGDSKSKPRSTYIGGMGEYLNKQGDVNVTGRVLQERRAVSRRIETPKLTIDVSLCSPTLAQGPTSAPAQGWYNRLILSPISSASSSVFSFLGHQHHHNHQGMEETPKIEEEDEDKGDSSMELFPSPPQELYPFRSWDF